MDRRKFIKSGCALCAGIAGGALLLSSLESCTPLPFYKAITESNFIKVPLDKFGGNNFLIVTADDFVFDIAIIRNNNEYNAMVMQCTHADNPVRFNGNEFRCNLHGSIFDRTGKVEKGPAEKPLSILKLEVKTDHLVIYV